MNRDQIFMGVAVALACGWGLWEVEWLLLKTRKGQWLVHRAGENKARWLLRSLLLAGLVFGVLLATDIIHPLDAVGP